MSKNIFYNMSYNISYNMYTNGTQYVVQYVIQYVIQFVIQYVIPYVIQYFIQPYNRNMHQVGATSWGPGKSISDWCIHEMMQKSAFLHSLSGTETHAMMWRSVVNNDMLPGMLQGLNSGHRLLVLTFIVSKEMPISSYISWGCCLNWIISTLPKHLKVWSLVANSKTLAKL